MMSTDSDKASGFLRNPVFHLIGLFLVSLALRLFHLDRMGFWIDEATCAYHVSIPFGDIYKSTVYYSNPPLFHYLVRPFYLFFGRDDFWLRFPSAVFGAAAVPLSYWALKRFLGVRAAAAGACFLVLSPFHLWYSQEFRAYSLLALEGFLSMFLWLRARESDAGAIWVGYAAVSIAGLYTHNWFAFLVAAQFLWLAVDAFAGKKYAGRNLLVLPVVPLVFAPWLITVIGRGPEDAGNPLRPPVIIDVWRTFQSFLFGHGFPFGDWFLIDVPGAVPLYLVPVVLPILGAFLPGRERKRSAEVFLVGLLVPLVLTYWFAGRVTPAFGSPRHAMILFPAYVWSVARLAVVLPGRWNWRFAALSAAWLAVTGLGLHFHYFKAQKASGKAIWEYVRSQPGEVRLVNQYLPIVERFPLNFYSGRDLGRLWETDRIPSASRLTGARYDLMVPVPHGELASVENSLPSGCMIRSRKTINAIDVLRLSRAGR